MKSALPTQYRVGERMPGTDWILRGVLGKGGMGTVYEVRKGRDLRAAMKVLHPDFARHREFEDRFEHEVEVMARLRHPNIVWVWDCGSLQDGSPFFLMELLTGRTLRALMRDKDMPLTAEAVWKIAGQLCAGLGHAHSDRPPVVHRDVKPENVFVHASRNGDRSSKSSTSVLRPRSTPFDVPSPSSEPPATWPPRFCATRPSVPKSTSMPSASWSTSF